MPAIYDSRSGRATSRPTKAKAKPKPKVIYAPQIKQRPSSSRAVTHVPGIGAVTRPTPRMKQAARTVEKAKPKPRAPRQPTAAERQRSQAKVRQQTDQAREPKRGRLPRAQTPFTKTPVKSFLEAERGAIGSLASLHRQDPKRYEEKLAKAKLGERVTAGPRGQTVEHFKGRTIGELLSDRPVKKLPKQKRIVVAGFRGQTRPKTMKANTVGEVIETAARNAPKNFADIVQDAPTSIAHTVKTAVTDPKRAVKETVQPYIDIAKNPTKEFAERPLTTTLTVTPLGRAPGLIAGRVTRKVAAHKARKAGRTPSDERPQAELPGTALRERRAGSRSAGKRSVQRREDRKAEPVKVTVRDTQRRVDEFWDFAQKRVVQARDRAAKATKDAAKDAGLTKAHMRAAVDDAVEQAGERAKRENDERFAQEFGANQRPSVGQRERLEAAAQRETTKGHVREAAAADRAARAEVESALGEARSRRGERSDQLTQLEAERVAALRQLAEHQAEHTRARVEHAKAEGAAKVSEAKKTSPKLSQLVRERKTAGRALTAAQAMLNKAKGKGESVKGGAGAAERALDELEAATKQLDDARAAVKGKRGTERARATRAVEKAKQRVAAAQGRTKETRAQRPAQVESTETIARAQKAVDDAKDAFNAVQAAIRAEEGRISGVAPREANRMHAAIAGLDDASARVRSQRQAIRDLDEGIAAERARTRGVHPEAANRLVNALVGRDEARAALLARQGEHSQAKQAHQATKTAAANSVLSDTAAQGRLFEHSYDAHRVKDQLNAAGHEIEVGSSTPVRSPVRYVMTENGVRLRRSGEATQPVKFKVTKVGDRYAVVPEIASHRRYLHDVTGTSKDTRAMLLRDTRRGLTTATLPFSLKWLGGQAGEAGLRSLVSGAGALDWYRLRQVVKRMNEISPGMGDEFMTRLPGTNFDVTGEARRSISQPTMAARYQGRSIEQPMAGLTWMGQTLPGKGAKHLVRGWNRVVLGRINNAIERTAITAMAGHAIKRDFMNERTLGLTESAIDEAARGLMNTPNQLAAARAVMDDYGKYSNFSPEMRNTIMHWTPYLPWYLNTVRFLFNTIRDHPIKASLLGAMTAATEEWRAEHGLSAYSDENQVPDWQRGSYPIFGDQLSRIGQFTPFGAFADPAGSLSGLGLPQATGVVAAGLGVDFTGRPLRDASTGKPFNWKQKILKGAVSGAEAQVPALGLGLRLSGLGPRYIDRKDPAKIAPFRTRLGRELPLWPLGDPGGGGGGFSLDDLDLDMGDEEINLDDLDLDLGG